VGVSFRCAASSRGVGRSLAGAGVALALASMANPTAHRPYAVPPAHAATRPSGRLLLVRSVRVAGHPIALAVNAQAGRVFVLTRGATTGRGRLVGDMLDVLDARTGAPVATVPLMPVRYLGIGTNPASDPTSDASTVLFAPQALVMDEVDDRAFVLDAGQFDKGASAGGGTIRAFDGTTGRPLYTAPDAGGPTGAAVGAPRGAVAVVNYFANTVTVLDARTGGMRRTLARGIGTQAQVVAVDAARGRLTVGSAGAGNAAGGTDGLVSVFDAHGALLRTGALYNGIPAAAAVDGGTGRVVLGAPSEHSSIVAVLDPARGAVVHSLSFAGAGAYPLVVDAPTGYAYVFGTPNYNGASGDVVSVIDTRRGRVVRTIAHGVTPGLAVTAVGALDARRRRVFVVTAAVDAPGAPGNLLVLNARTGDVALTEGLRGGPLVVAVNERAGRLVVAAANGMIYMFDTTHL